MPKVYSVVAGFLLAMLATICQAQVVVGESVPALEINEPGELILEDKENITYQPWSTDVLVAKVHVVQYLAGRLRVKNMNKPFTDALEAEDFPAEHLYTTTIINLDDTMFGTSGIVNSQLKSNKIKYWFTSIVADREGDGAKAWQLQPKSSAIIVLSPTSEVLFFKDGKLSDTEIAEVITLIEQQTEQFAMSVKQG